MLNLPGSRYLRGVLACAQLDATLDAVAQSALFPPSDESARNLPLRALRGSVRDSKIPASVFLAIMSLCFPDFPELLLFFSFREHLTFDLFNGGSWQCLKHPSPQ